jgi:hypothetical protein
MSRQLFPRGQFPGYIARAHRKYKRLKLGGGQAYDRSNDYAAVVA